MTNTSICAPTLAQLVELLASNLDLATEAGLPACLALDGAARAEPPALPPPRQTSAPALPPPRQTEGPPLEVPQRLQRGTRPSSTGNLPKRQLSLDADARERALSVGEQGKVADPAFGRSGSDSAVTQRARSAHTWTKGATLPPEPPAGDDDAAMPEPVVAVVVESTYMDMLTESQVAELGIRYDEETGINTDLAAPMPPMVNRAAKPTAKPAPRADDHEIYVMPNPIQASPRIDGSSGSTRTGPVVVHKDTVREALEKTR